MHNSLSSLHDRRGITVLMLAILIIAVAVIAVLAFRYLRTGAAV